MKHNFVQSISKQMAALTTLTDLPVLWKDAGGGTEPELPLVQCRHCNPLCRKVKEKEERLKQCSMNDCVIVASLFDNHKEGIIHRCHAGADELLVPIFIGGIYAGAFFLGPFRRKDAVSTYPDCKKEFTALPRYEEENIAAAAMLLQMLEHFTAEQRNLLTLRQISTAEENIRLKPALDYINRAFAADLTANDAAAKCHLSLSRFIHLFKEKCGIGFSEYLTQRRIEEAKILLTGSDLKIFEVGIRCGFHNQSYFGLVFRQTTGLSPAVYRNKFRRCLEP